MGSLNAKDIFERQWNIGRCKGLATTTKNGGERCCLNPGKYALICQNLVRPFGWGKASIKIQGQEYCNDFVGFKAIRSVSISGKLM